MPKLSIITINYNNALGLQKTMESVFSQSYTDFEYIVIDGGSSDGSKEIIEKCSNGIFYWVSENDKGVYNAQNKGVLKAAGEYVLFLNSGDYFNDINSINYLLENSNGEDIIYGDIIYKSRTQEKIIITPGVLDFEFLSKNTIPHSSTLIKRDLFCRHGLYQETFNICADWAFFLDIIVKHNATYRHITKAITVFELGGISSRPENNTIVEKERLDYLNKEYSFIINEHKKLINFQQKLNLLSKGRLIRTIRRFFPQYLKHIIPL